jgi:hypothetical protein
MDKVDTIIEGNKLILLFMGGVIGSSTKYPTGEVIIRSIHLGDKQINDFINDAKYHSDWNLLMGVVERISKEHCLFRLAIGNVSSVAHFEDSDLKKSCEPSTIEAVWQAVTQFIIFYNSQNTKQ